MGAFDDLPDETSSPAPVRRGGVFDDLPDEVAAPKAALPPANDQREAGDYIRSRVQSGQKFTPETVAATYEAFHNRAKGNTGPAKAEAIAPENPFERAGLAMSQAIAKPITGFEGLINPAYGETLRQNQANVYGSGGVVTDENTSGKVGGFAGSVVNAPLALTPVGRVLSAAGAAGNKRTDIAERRANGEQISGLDEFANATGAAGVDMAFNKINTGAVNATVVNNLAKNVITNKAGQIAANLALEGAAATGLGYARQGLDNVVDMGTSKPNQQLTHGMDAELGITSGLQGLMMAGVQMHTNRGNNANVHAADPVAVHDPSVVTADGTLSPSSIDPIGPHPDSAVLPGQEHAGLDQQSQMDVAALNERLAAFEPEPNVPKTPEQLAQEQAAKLADDHADAAFKQADFLPPDQISPEDAAIGKGFEDRAANADLTDRRVAQTPIDPAAERRFDEVTKGATFETPEQAGANPFFANMKGQSNGQAQTTGSPAPVPHSPQPVAPAAQPAAPQPAPAPAPTPAQPAGPSPAVAAGVTPKNTFFQRTANTVAAGLRSRGNLPKSIDNLNRMKQGEVTSRAQSVEQGNDRLAQAIKAETPDADAGHMQLVHKALEGDAAAVAQLPPKTADAVAKMRSEIDTGTQDVQDSGAVGVIGNTIIEGNKGQYVQRKYRVHDDANYAPTKEARDAAHAELTKQGFSPDEANSRIETMLNDWADAKTEGGSAGKLNPKDFSSMIERKTIEPWIRDLMGEHKSPFTTFAKTVMSQAELAANHRFLERTKAVGTAEGWLHEDSTAPVGFTQRIAFPEDHAFSPLNGMRTTKEVAKAFNDIGTTAVKEYALPVRMLLAANRLAKTAATTGSMATQAVNMMGQPFFNMASGIVPTLGKYHSAAKAATTDSPTLRAAERFFGKGRLVDSMRDGKVGEYLKDFHKYVPGGDTVSEGMLVNELKKANQHDVDLEPQDKNVFQKAKDIAKKVIDKPADVAAGIYQVPDKLGKFIHWDAEVARAKEAYPSMPEHQQKQIAADRVLNTVPSYSKLPAAVKALRFSPFGPFAGFTWESTRTLANNAIYGMQDMKAGLQTGNKALVKHGAQRLAGLTVVAGAGAAAAALSKKLVGVSDDEEENFRKNQPGYNENHNVIFTGRQPGKMSYFDVSRFNPYAPILDSIKAVSRAESVPDAAVKGLSEYVGQNFGASQLFQSAMTDVQRNRTEAGRSISNPDDPLAKQLQDKLNHLAKALEPGSFKRLRTKIIPALKGESTDFGEELNAPSEIAYEASGLRGKTMDYDTSLGFKASQYGDQKRQTVKEFTRVAGTPGMKDADAVVDAYNTMEDRREAHFNEFKKLVDGAEKVGLAKKTIAARLRLKGVSDKEIGQLFAGEYVPYNPADSGLPEVQGKNKDFPVKQLMAAYKARAAARKVKQ